MAVVIPSTYNSTTAYADAAQVLHNGVVYENTSGGSLTGVDPAIDNRWTVRAVHQICDYYSLIEAVRLNINVDNDEINRSVPLFIQLAEESFKTRIRAPQQRKRVILTTDSDSKIEAPNDLLEVINVRQNSNSNGSRDIRARGVIEILNGNYENYQELLRYDQASQYVGAADVNAYDAPVYWFDNRYFWIAPRYDSGTEIELWYYGIIPKLGTTVMVNNAPITVTQNWFTAAAPQMLLYGALCKSEAYLKDPERIAQWKALFEEAQVETQDMINRFEDSQPHSIFMENAYASKI